MHLYAKTPHLHTSPLFSGCLYAEMPFLHTDWAKAFRKKASHGSDAFFVPFTKVFSNLLLEGIERLWEVHEFLPNPKRFPLATEDSVS